MTDLLSTNSMKLMEKSMEYLWTKQAAHLDNIANAETPGYKVKTVTFEEQFQQRLDRALREQNKTGQLGKLGRKRAAAIIEESKWEVWEDEEITRMDKNGVNITEQMVEMSRTAFQQQYLFQAVTSDITTLRTAITG